MTPSLALDFVREHGVVLEAGRGPVPSLAETIAGEPIRGSWWSHPRSHQIFAVTRAVRDAEEILVCRLVGGKITYVHRRLWPALVRLATRLPLDRLARVEESHTPSGRHVAKETPYPQWVPPGVRQAARALDEREARELLGSAVAATTEGPGGARRPSPRARPSGARGGTKKPR